MEKNKNIYNLLLYLSISITLISCQQNLTQNTSNDLSNCPINPNKITELKEIPLNKNILSGIVKQGEDIGYQFEGKKGQNLSLSMGNNICFWIYDPSGKQLNLAETTELPMDGEYTLQLGISQGVTTYSVNFNLQDQSAVITNNLSGQITSVDRPAPSAFIINHYNKIQEGNYQESWQELTDYFQETKAKNYNEYINWWSQVEEISIGEINLINISENEANLIVSLAYTMTTGKVFYDRKNQFTLLWNPANNNWEIHDKK